MVRLSTQRPYGTSPSAASLMWVSRIGTSLRQYNDTPPDVSSKGARKQRERPTILLSANPCTSPQVAQQPLPKQPPVFISLSKGGTMRLAPTTTRKGWHRR